MMTSNYLVSPYVITQLTHTNILQGASHPAISGNNIVWEQWDDYASINIGLYLYDGSNIRQIATNTYGSNVAQISGNHVVWQAYDQQSNDLEIFFYNGTQTQQLTDNNLRDSDPQISGNQAVWTQSDDYDYNKTEVYYYNGLSVQPLTNDNYPDTNLKISGNNIIWVKTYRDNNPTPDDPADVYWFDGITVRNLTENFGHISENPQIFGNQIVWTEKYYTYDGYGSATIERGIYVYNGQAINKLDIENANGFESMNSPNGYQIEAMIGNDYVINAYGRGVYLYNPGINLITPILSTETLTFFTIQSSENNLMISATSGYPDSPGTLDGIYSYSNSQLTQLVQFTNQSTLGFDPVISGNSIAWWGYPDGQIAQVFLAKSLIATAIDFTQYGASNPDLMIAFQSLPYDQKLIAFEQHYYTYGYLEQRPIDNFNELQYLASNPDLVFAFGNDPILATQHYILYGFWEGRSLDSFQEDIYLASNPDLIQFLGYNLEGATQHYINYGIYEGRPKNNFDPFSYLNNNPDLQSVFGTDTVAATQHYITYGYGEGRTWMG